MNRYTNITPSQFNPLTMEEIFSVPLMKQKKHDQTQAQLDEMGIFDLNRLQADDDTAKQYVNDYRNRIDAETDSIMSKGISNQSVRNVRNLVRDKNKWMSNDGVGGKIQANYKAFQDYKTTLDEALKSKRIGNETYHGLLNQAVKDYQGVANDGKLNLEAAALQVDVNNKLQTYAKDIMSNPIKYATNTGFIYNPSNNRFENVKTKVSLHPKDFVKTLVKNFATSDQEIMSYLNQQNALGLMGDTNDYLDKVATTFDSGYSVNQTDQTMSGSFMPQYMSEGKEDTTTPTGEYGNDEIIDSYEDDIYDDIARIGTERPEETEVTEWRGNSGAVKTVKGGIYTVEDMSEESKQTYDRLYDGLLERGLIENANPDNKYSESTTKLISDYIKNTKNVRYQPIKHTTGLVRTWNNLGEKIKTTTPEDLAKTISLNPENRVYYDLVEKKEKTYDELSASQKEELLKGDTRVSGTYDPKNYYPQTLSNTTSKDAFVAPYELQFSDNTKLLVSPSKLERDKPAYKAAIKFNDVWGNTNMYPDIPYQVDMYGSQIKVTKLSDTGEYIINTVDDKGNVLKSYQGILNDEHLENIINKWTK